MNEFTELTPAEARSFLRGSEPWRLRPLVARLAGPDALEVGCGNGLLLAHLGPGAVGVDVSRPLLAVARETHAGPLVEADAARLPFLPGAFACACAVSLLEHVPSLAVARTILAEMLRVAGRVVVGWHSPPGDAPTMERIVTGHFGRACHSNRYGRADLLAGIVSHVVVHPTPDATDGSEAWEMAA